MYIHTCCRCIEVRSECAVNRLRRGGEQKYRSCLCQMATSFCHLLKKSCKSYHNRFCFQHGNFFYFNLQLWSNVLIFLYIMPLPWSIGLASLPHRARGGMHRATSFLKILECIIQIMCSIKYIVNISMLIYGWSSNFSYKS